MLVLQDCSCQIKNRFRLESLRLIFLCSYQWLFFTKFSCESLRLFFRNGLIFSGVNSFTRLSLGVSKLCNLPLLDSEKNKTIYFKTNVVGIKVWQKNTFFHEIFVNCVTVFFFVFFFEYLYKRRLKKVYRSLLFQTCSIICWHNGLLVYLF